jgi:ankyrin repeat protein
MTLLSHAAQNGCEVVVRLLLARDDTEVNSEDNRKAPLLLAAQNGHEGVVMMLSARARGDIRVHLQLRFGWNLELIPIFCWRLFEKSHHVNVRVVVDAAYLSRLSCCANGQHSLCQFRQLSIFANLPGRSIMTMWGALRYQHHIIGRIFSTNPI